MRKGESSNVGVSEEFSARRANVSEALTSSRVDALLVTGLPNVRYLSGFTGSNAMLLVTEDRAVLFTDPRYQTQAPVETDCEIKISKGQVLDDLVKVLKRFKVGRLGFERGRMSFELFDALKRALKGVRLSPLAGLIERFRMVKSAAEAGTIKAAVELNSAALERALRAFRHDMTEVDLAAEIEYSMRQLGADGPSFDTIVASGDHSALPHAHPRPKGIEGDHLLLIDMGATVAGYASDMTRTFAVGHLAPKAKRLYRAVLESQLAAIDSVRAGVLSSSVDRAARGVLKRYGFDKLFIHSTGHGLGLEIHEMPRVGRKEPTRLEAGMTITVEPGAYVEGFGGVRIEDTVLVTENGCQVLTPTTKDLVVL